MATGIHWRFWERGQGGCAATEPLLSLYADGMASPPEVRRVEAHLGDCEDCRQALQWMQITRQAIVSRSAVAPPAELRGRIARAIAELEAAQAPARAPRRPVTLRPALGYGFATALIVAAGWGLWNENGPAHVAVSPVPHRITVAGNNSGHPAISVAPTSTPTSPAKRSHRSSIAPLTASRETVKPPRLLVRRYPTAPVVSPDMTTASTDTGRGATPPRISPIETRPRLIVTHHAPHAVPTSPGPLLANNAPLAHLHRPAVKPLHTETGPLMANLPHTQTLPEGLPPSVHVLPPAVTPDVEVHTASLTPSVNDTLRGIAVYVQQKAALTGRGFAANRRTVAATFAVATADSSGTANITEGPVR